MDPASSDPDAAELRYLEAASREWEREWQRKPSLEQRGITVITASGVLVTLAFGFASAVSKGHHFANFTHLERVLLAIGLGFFILAAFCGLMTNMPARVGAIPLDALRVRTPSRASGSQNVDGGEGRSLVEATISGVGSVRAVNSNKANWLVVGFLLQLVAISLLGATVIAVVA